MPNKSALMRFLTTTENRSALTAIEGLLHELTSYVATNPLYLHGPTGTGKTHLARVLADEAIRLGCSICTLSANDFAEREAFTLPAEANDADVLIVEDLQHLPTRFVDTLVSLIDQRVANERPLVCTALCGPGQLNHRGVAFPNRLTTRLAAGLVVAIEPLGAPSRRRLLDQIADANHVKIADDILAWLATQLTGGGRQLTGAIVQLKELQRLQKKPLQLDDVRAHFHAQIEATALTVARITEHVGACYCVQPKQLRSAKRSREVLLPRQISMYLARQLTKLSLQKIGHYFGGRDHKTVLHACQKVTAAIKSDRALSGTVCRLRAELA